MSAAASPQYQYGRNILNSALLALLLEAAFILLLVTGFSHSLAGKSSALANVITLADPTPAIEQAKPDPPKPPIVEKSKAAPLLQKPEVRPVIEKPPLAETGIPTEEKKEIPPPNPHPVLAETRVATIPATAAPAATVSSSPNAEYIAKIRAAVQASFVYPPAAISLGFHGKVRLKFHLSHKTPSNPSVLVGSGMGLIDKAAIQSVMTATYPDPPQDQKNPDMDCEVWIEYRP